ncbi:MAG: hypothetical protein KGL35_21940 [Bradyrhizobium sp.]|uniref:hypothetical protein n=1 Tax=Bradyrhizobium sp. TaxID=376 RepID=UPI001C294743|nr:hypothetical protein [Bradyrhizobium sp.]MBU6463238.1 hypothetical protein [Pseudomonadota bacterium]MDE2068108.1 hypothetical protein [Bradyrhizobium sp.]MDE2471318.1 hypothetical protein [Bradyrhizobium sp.]
MTAIGFTGTQEGMTEAQKATLLRLLEGGAGEFHHGDCIGADAQAHAIAVECGYCPILHPPTNHSKRAWCDVPPHLMRPEKPYLARNRDIVDEASSLIATPLHAEEQQRSGTWSTLRYARSRGKPVFLILPDGSIGR